MAPRIIGDHPQARDPTGKLRSRIATVFPHANTIVTLPGIHAMQRLAFLEMTAKERAAGGGPGPTREEEAAVWHDAVDLILEDGAVLIRPDPENMPLAFKADELLQEIIPKHKIKFLAVRNDKVRKAIEHRGECWRITPLPRSAPEMIAMIAASKMGIGGREIYYYNRLTGTHVLTCQEFSQLDALDDSELRQHLVEIRDLSVRFNRLGSPEIAFFMAPRFGSVEFRCQRFEELDDVALRSAFADLRRKFEAAVAPEFREDDPASTEWRNRMAASLIEQGEETVSEELLLGLSSEFYMQIQWLSGCRVEEGELIFDPIFEFKADGAPDPELDALRDDKCRGIIFNFVREYGDLEHINIGRVIGSLSHRGVFFGRRDVYVAVVKLRETNQEIVNIVRMQKWGVREHLDKGKSLLDAILEADRYTEYIFDRRLGCRQLGMNLPMRVTARKLAERYWGDQLQYRGITIWSTYFQRDYIRGIASDKIPIRHFEDPRFATRFAELLGQAAAPNLIVGRCDLNGHVLFDDGDEVVLEDDDGFPTEIVVSDQTGTFVDYARDLDLFAADYARPISRRIKHVSQPEAFISTYLGAFEEHFTAIQEEYRKRKRAFDTLFRHQHSGEEGSFAFRWERVLQRMNRADPQALTRLIREKIAAQSVA